MWYLYIDKKYNIGRGAENEKNGHTNTQTDKKHQHAIQSDCLTRKNTHLLHKGKYYCRYSWSPLWLVWIQKVNYVQITPYFHVQKNPIKLESRDTYPYGAFSRVWQIELNLHTQIALCRLKKTRYQCDHMLEYKVAQMFQKSPKSSYNRFYTRVRFHKIVQKVGNLLGYFCYKFCHQEFSKIAQSGHPARYLHLSTS